MYGTAAKATPGRKIPKKGAAANKSNATHRSKKMPHDRKPVRILLTGGSGLLGSHLIARRPSWADLVATYHTRPIRPAGAEAAYLDLADPSGPEKIIRTGFRS